MDLAIPSFAFISASLDAASAFGLAAVIAALLWPFYAKRETVLLIQCIGTSAFALHFILIEALTAAGTSCIVLIQLLTAAAVRSRLQLWLIYSASGVVLIFLTFATWHGLPSILASTASLLGMFSRLQRSTTRMKTGLLISCPLWATHNFMVGSVFGLTIDAASGGTLVFVLCKKAFWRHAHPNR